MGASNPPDEAGKFITRVDIHTHTITTAKGETLTLADINSNCPITFPLEDDPEMRLVYGLSVAIRPRQPVYLDTGDISLILVHCGDTVGRVYRQYTTLVSCITTCSSPRARVPDFILHVCLSRSANSYRD